MDLLLVERGLGSKIKPVEVAHEREPCQLDAHLDPALVRAGDLALAEQREGLADRLLAPFGLIEQTVELVADGGQLPAPPQRASGGNQAYPVGQISIGDMG